MDLGICGDPGTSPPWIRKDNCLGGNQKLERKEEKEVICMTFHSAGEGEESVSLNPMLFKGILYLHFRERN